MKILKQLSNNMNSEQDLAKKIEESDRESLTLCSYEIRKGETESFPLMAANGDDELFIKANLPTEYD